MRKEISIDLAYHLTEYLFSNHIYTINKYKKLLQTNKFINIIDNIFRDYEIVPEIQDYLFGVVFISKEGIKRASKRIVEVANERLMLKGQSLVSDEKNVFLKQTLRNSKKTINKK